MKQCQAGKLTRTSSITRVIVVAQSHKPGRPSIQTAIVSILYKKSQTDTRWPKVSALSHIVGYLIWRALTLNHGHAQRPLDRQALLAGIRFYMLGDSFLEPKGSGQTAQSRQHSIMWQSQPSVSAFRFLQPLGTDTISCHIFFPPVSWYSKIE